MQIVIHPDMDIMKLRSTIPCEFRLISTTTVREVIGETTPFHDGLEERGLALAG
jgi:hypothetical protein